MKHRLAILAAATLLAANSTFLVQDAVAGRLGKKACAALTSEHGRLVREGVLKAMAQGPEWASANLDAQVLGRISRFLTIEGEIRFRCPRGRVKLAALPEQPPGGWSAAKQRSVHRPEPPRVDRPAESRPKPARKPKAQSEQPPVRASAVTLRGPIVPVRKQREQSAPSPTVVVPPLTQLMREPVLASASAPAAVPVGPTRPAPKRDSRGGELDDRAAVDLSAPQAVAKASAVAIVPVQLVPLPERKPKLKNRRTVRKFARKPTRARRAPRRQETVNKTPAVEAGLGSYGD